MKILRIIIVAVMAAGLSGCFKNEKEFEAVRVTLRQRPDIQAKGLAECEGDIKHSHIELKRDIAGYARIKMDDALPRTICKRLLSGYLSGRMKWEDYRALTSSSRQRVTPTMIRIIRSG
jgi:hypothetical protein